MNICVKTMRADAANAPRMWAVVEGWSPLLRCAGQLAATLEVLRQGIFCEDGGNKKILAERGGFEPPLGCLVPKTV